MFNAHAAGCNQRGKSLHFFVVQLKEAIVRLVAAVYIHCFECGIYILYQKCRVKVSLNFRAILHGVPALAEVLLRKCLRQMVKLACLYGKGINLFERPASADDLAFERLYKESRSFIADGFSKSLLADEFAFAVGLGLFRPFRQCAEAHLFDVVFITKGK